MNRTVRMFFPFSFLYVYLIDIAKGFLFFLQFIIKYSQLSRVFSTFLPSPCPPLFLIWAWLRHKSRSLLGYNGQRSTVYAKPNKLRGHIPLSESGLEHLSKSDGICLPIILQGGEVASRQAHNLKVAGSNPAPATMF